MRVRAALQAAREREGGLHVPTEKRGTGGGLITTLPGWPLRNELDHRVPDSIPVGASGIAGSGCEIGGFRAA